MRGLLPCNKSLSCMFCAKLLHMNSLLSDWELFLILGHCFCILQVALPAETTTGTCFLQHYIESILALQEVSSKLSQG